MRIYTFNCPKCGGGLEVRGTETTVRCHYCSSSVIVPESLRLKEASPPEPAGRPLWIVALLAILVVFAVILVFQGMLRPARESSALRDQEVVDFDLPAPITTELTANPTLSIPPSSVTQIALDSREYSGFTVYWKRDLWTGEISDAAAIEDFGLDTADYGELSFPYITGNGLYLSGNSTAQILVDNSLMPDGTFIHFRDWEGGLSFSFPNNGQISAFSFDFRASEALWQLWVNGESIEIPDGRPGFVGVVFDQDYAAVFTLRGPDGAQGGLSVDNIAYVLAP